MYTLLGQNLYFRRADNPDLVDFYGELCSQLLSYVEGDLGDASADTEAPEGLFRQVAVDRWEADATVSDHRSALLNIGAMQRLGACDWSIRMTLASIQPDEVVFESRWSLPELQSPIPAEERPALSPFAHVTALDMDGRIAGGLYALSAERVPPFIRFLESPERRLPVVLISPFPHPPHPHESEIIGFSHKLLGQAHVMRLRDQAAVDALRALMPKLACYNGSIRIYWTGFHRRAAPPHHPYYYPSDVKRNGPAILEEIQEQVLDQTARLLRDNLDIQALERQRRNEQARRAADDHQTDRDFDELFVLYEQTADRNQELDADNARLAAQVRRLQWHLNNATMGAQLEDETPALEPEELVLLSAQAAKTYRELHADERSYWDNHVLPKLCDDQLRQNQSKRIDGGWVYPRSRTGAGRRVTYYCEGQHVYVCNLYLKADHDTAYSDEHTVGLDRQAYDGFVPWAQALGPGAPPAAPA